MSSNPNNSKPVLQPGENSDNKQKLLKGLYLVLFLGIGYVSVFIILLVTILHFVLDFVLKTPNKNLTDFSSSLTTYVHEVVSFLTYVSEKKPFPFSPWPK